MIHERLHALDIINERFARYFRMSLFNLIRRSIDITVKSALPELQRIFDAHADAHQHQPAGDETAARYFSALVVFPPSVVFMVVDNLFGGDGRFVTKSRRPRNSRTPSSASSGVC